LAAGVTWHQVAANGGVLPGGLVQPSLCLADLSEGRERSISPDEPSALTRNPVDTRRHEVKWCLGFLWGLRTE